MIIGTLMAFKPDSYSRLKAKMEAQKQLTTPES
jgi:hypothetical protein